MGFLIKKEKNVILESGKCSIQKETFPDRLENNNIYKKHTHNS